MPTKSSESVPDAPVMSGAEAPQNHAATHPGAPVAPVDSKRQAEGTGPYPPSSFYQGQRMPGYGGSYPSMQQSIPYGPGGSGPFPPSVQSGAASTGYGYGGYGRPPSYGYGHAYDSSYGYFPSQHSVTKSGSPGRSSRGGLMSSSATSSKGKTSEAISSTDVGTTPEARSDVSGSGQGGVHEDDSEIQRLRAAAEKELTTSDVQPIRTDYHFFVLDMKDKLRPEAEKEVRESNNDKTDLYLVNSNLNCRLMHAWEVLSPSEREEYEKKEQEDRKRFMEEEEVASRHCATLTARAKSPDPNKPEEKDGAELIGGEHEFLTSQDDFPGDKRMPPSEKEQDDGESPAKKNKLEGENE